MMAFHVARLIVRRFHSSLFLERLLDTVKVKKEKKKKCSTQLLLPGPPLFFFLLLSKSTLRFDMAQSSLFLFVLLNCGAMKK